jgi:hypothetical protein
MIYTGVAIALGVLAAGVALLALRLLFGRHWLLGWLRGMFGLVLLALAVVVALAAWDLRGYHQVLAEQPLGTLAFSQQGEQHFAVTLVGPEGNEQHFELNGDMWQLDVRMLKWTDALARLGFKPGYRLDRLSGRYVTLEDEQQRPRSVLALRSDKPTLDVWYWLHRINHQFSLLDATYGSATYMPMVDGAMFSVSMGSSGLVARPLNERAKLAVERWQ